MGKTYHLKRKADHFTGTAGKDSFLAPAKVVDGLEYPTWTNRDVLDGGRGSDTITARVDGASLTPRMKSIENAVLSRTSTDALALDLAKAGNLRAITLTDFHSDATISHAARLKSFSMFDAGSLNAIQLQGLDAAKIGTASYLFGNSIMSLDVQTLNDASLKAVNLSLTDSNITLSGDIGAQSVVIHSNGTVGNNLVIDGDALAGTETVTIDGLANLNFTPGKLDGLLSLEAGAMSGNLKVSLGGDTLTSLQTGSGGDDVILADLGGTAEFKAVVDLGEGNDSLNLMNLAIDPATQSFLGGGGLDFVYITGALADVGSVMQDFEGMVISGASGAYDFAGSGVKNVNLNTPVTDVTFDNLESGSSVVFSSNADSAIVANVAGANGSDADFLYLTLYDSVVGSAANGFSAPGLSSLGINSSGNAGSTLYLGQIGAANDYASVYINGNKGLTVSAIANSTSYIHELIVTSAISVNLLGLADGASAFVATGALISGGAGNDVLVGGAGADTINSNGGDDIVHGSLGADTINLVQAVGQDAFIFSDAAHSTLSAVDTITGFGGNDVIHVGNLVPSVVFAGNVATESDGLALLSAADVKAFYAMDTDMLYVDLDHDGAITDGADLVVHLSGLAAFGGGAIIANDWPI